MKSEVFVKKFLARIKKMSTLDLTALFAALGFLVLFSTMPIQNSNLSERLVKSLIPFLAALGFYLLGCPGLVCIVRRECPILPLGHAIKGGLAVLIGIVILLLGLSIGTLFLSFIWR
jgi:hypothetical protein